MPEPAAPALATLLRVFLRIGLLSFGGPAAQVALLHRELVARRGWIDGQEFLAALSFCMLLPGPEAMQLATWAGWRLGGVPGGLIAGGLFVLPGAAVVLALAVAYGVWGSLPPVQAAFLGIQAAVVAIVAEAVVRLGRRALRGPAAWAIAAASFAGIFAFAVPFPAVLAAAALVGLAAPAAGGGPRLPADAAADTASPRPAAGAAAPTVLAGLALWLGPLAALALLEGGFLARLGAYFATLAVISFGGAYAVLAHIAQTAVAERGWLTADEMMDGLGLAEATPGPLILVLAFVAYLAGLREGDMLLGLAAAGVALWMTFLPSFLVVFAGAPWIHRIVALPRLAAALAAVTAAVVGVILSLAVGFALHVAFAQVGTRAAGPVRLPAPELASLDPLAVALALAAGGALLGLGWGVARVLALAGFAGVAAHLAGL